MSDDLSHRGPHDRDRININQDHELRHWSRSLGVPPQRIKEAVQAVGDRVDKVRDYLAKPRAGTKAGSIEALSERKGPKRASDRKR